MRPAAASRPGCDVGPSPTGRPAPCAQISPVAAPGPPAPPVLAVAPVGPPLPLDPPLADHVGHLVAAPAPLERRRHPGVAFDEDLFVEALGHLVPRPVVYSCFLYPTSCDSNICSRREDDATPLV